MSDGKQNTEHQTANMGGLNMDLSQQALEKDVVSQRQLAEGLRAEMKGGRWDGTDANATPKVNELRRGFLAGRTLRQLRESSATTNTNVI
jgi:hypothetical protein